jgi:hypothetical protein
MQAYWLDTVELARLLFGVAAAVLQWGVGLFGFSIARQYAVDARWFSASTAILGWMTSRRGANTRRAYDQQRRGPQPAAPRPPTGSAEAPNRVQFSVAAAQRAAYGRA